MWKIRNFPNLMRGTRDLVLSRVSGAPVLLGRVYVKKTAADGSITDYGLVSTRVITTLFAAYVVDAFQDSTTYPLDVFKYHDSGEGTTAEAAADTTLETPTGLARSLGTRAEGATTNIYRSVATTTYDATYAITEHGLFSAETEGILLDRSVFAPINVVNGETMQFTYELSVTAGV